MCVRITDFSFFVCVCFKGRGLVVKLESQHHTLLLHMLQTNKEGERERSERERTGKMESTDIEDFSFVVVFAFAKRLVLPLSRDASVVTLDPHPRKDTHTRRGRGKPPLDAKGMEGGRGRQGAPVPPYHRHLSRPRSRFPSEEGGQDRGKGAGGEKRHTHVGGWVGV